MRGCNKASQNLDEKETLDMINRMKDKKTGSLYHLTSTDFRTEFTPNIFTHCSNSIQGALNATDYKYTHPFLVELRCNSNIQLLLQHHIYRDVELFQKQVRM